METDDFSVIITDKISYRCSGKERNKGHIKAALSLKQYHILHK